MLVRFRCTFLFIVLFYVIVHGNYEGNSKLPIIFVYTVVPAVCKYGLPEYIKISLEQAIFTQPDSDVIMASNYADCDVIAKTVSEVPGLIQIDTTKIASNYTTQFANLSTAVFSSDYAGELWITSALRFFILEDIMISNNYKELLHVEADNTLYGRISSILPVLRADYPLAVTPLTANKFMMTASVFWVSSVEALHHFNGYMMDMVQNNSVVYKEYLGWMRRYACCKKGGVDPDQNGNGIKPYAINEMSMLANYNRIYPDLLRLLPVAPVYDSYVKRRPYCDVSQFAPGGTEVGAATGRGIWDPNSWGQHIGGTSRKKGRDKGFVDGSHIAGQAMILAKCAIHMMCGNQTVSPYAESTPNIIQKTPEGCYTAPFVRCGEESPWTPLWNLHVHSKHTQDYRSVACPCPDAQLQ